ncbi:unnamed protein product [Clonostachys rhizophaga]|uniref:C2H2-type domain-containing protein n=1 Tax=Clonostachys rhizophaga TaxID=160324 RepID=A0A9N9VXY7_9HYPO|nr:unnamed protein product [Clonostachys rhizophaga]
MTLRLAMMGSTSQAATHSPAFHSTIDGYNNDAPGGIPTPRSSPVASATDLGSNLISLADHSYVTFDKAKDNTVNNSEDRPGNDAACAPQRPMTAELFAACVLLQLANPEGRTLIEVATEDQWMQLQAPTRHKRTVHRDNLKGKTSICTNGDCAKDDDFPKRCSRADNFRAHLKSVHKIEHVSDIDWQQYYSTLAESVADEEQFVALDDDTENEKGGVEFTENGKGGVEITENEKAGVEINEDKFGEYFNGLTQAEMLKFLALVPATDLQAALRQKEEAPKPDTSQPSAIYRCGKTFGSKDDWKRHEGQQHTPPEMWVCEKKCGKVFGSCDCFKLHLEDSHHEMSTPTKEAKLEDDRQNIYSAPLFWCVFCRCPHCRYKRSSGCPL